MAITISKKLLEELEAQWNTALLEAQPALQAAFEAGLQAGKGEPEHGRAAERREFIRRAAVALYADSGAERSPDESWQQAQWLWGAKPEDC